MVEVDPYVAKVEAHQSTVYWEQIAAQVLSEWPVWLEQPVLDYGCGTGKFARILRDVGGAVRAVDCRPAMIERARQLDPEAPPDTYATTIGDGTFDVAYLLNVLGHIGLLHLDLTAIVSHVRRGGQVVVLNPNRLHYVLRWPANRLSGYRADPTIEHRFTPWQLRRLMASHGLSLVSHRMIGERFAGQSAFVLDVYTKAEVPPWEA